MTAALRFTALTLFPEMFEVIRNEGVVARALEKNLLTLDTVFLREFAALPRRSVDDHPVGGGDGMVIRPDIADAALKSVLQTNSKVIHLTPGGKLFSSALARELALEQHLILLCGRYAGFDARFIHQYSPLEVSIGDFVLSGGELPALCMIDSIARFIPGVLGNNESSNADSFENGLLEAPAFTKPLEFNGQHVPEVLLSGNHKKIAQWNRQEQLRTTAKNRPDLIHALWDSLSRTEKSIVERVWRNGVQSQSKSTS